MRRPSDRLDVLLELLERRELSPEDLRVLVATVEGERTLPQLVRSLRKPAPTVRRAAWRLYLKGLLRQRHDDASQQPAFAITTRGLMVVKPLLTGVSTLIV